MWKVRKVRHIIVGVVLLGLITLQYDSYRHQYSGEFLRSLKGPIPYDQFQLIRYIRSEILQPPSNRPYNISVHVTSKMVINDSELFYQKYLQEIFKLKKGGFFVEAGALDGQAMSNTLWLEIHQGWTGLLVEPDPSSYAALKYKNRRSWSANTCLSIEKYPKMEKLSTASVIRSSSYNDPRERSMGQIVKMKPHGYNAESNDVRAMKTFSPFRVFYKVKKSHERR